MNPSQTQEQVSQADEGQDFDRTDADMAKLVPVSESIRYRTESEGFWSKSLHYKQRFEKARLAREASGNRMATAALASPGVATAVWPAKVKSHVDYNVYKVRRVIIEDAGVAPTELGEELEAANLAESFTSQGTLAAGTYAIIVRIGERHVFHAEP